MSATRSRSTVSATASAASTRAEPSRRRVDERDRRELAGAVDRRRGRDFETGCVALDRERRHLVIRCRRGHDEDVGGKAVGHVSLRARELPFAAGLSGSGVLGRTRADRLARR
jgi:hypothetical protein